VLFKEVDVSDSSEPDSPTGEYFTMREAARNKGVSYHTVSRAVRSGKLISRRSGRMNLISREDLTQWQPMRERAPRKYRQREPEPIHTPAVIELASGERIELARRLTAIYEAIHTSAIRQPLDEFLRLLTEQFARAMSFERVALWLINEARTEIEHSASYGTWYEPDDEPERIVLPYDPETMYLSRSDVYDGITCWTTPPPINTGPAFSASLVVGQVHVGYIIGDRNGAALTLSDAQVQLGSSLATQAAITIDLKRTRLREAHRTRQLEAVLERISEPVMVYSADRRITAMSRVARRMYGLPEDLDLAAEAFSLFDLDLGSVHHRGVGSTNPPSDRALAGEVVRNVEF
jgi:excisionase family DNA binding protein